MKTNRYTKCILCEGDTLQEAVDKFNAEMKSHAAFKTRFERAGEAFLIYVDVEELAPETIAEAKHLEGCDRYCTECSECVREKNRFGNIDARKIFGYCARQNMRKIRIDQTVCDDYFINDLEMRKEG